MGLLSKRKYTKSGGEAVKTPQEVEADELAAKVAADAAAAAAREAEAKKEAEELRKKVQGLVQEQKENLEAMKKLQNTVNEQTLTSTTKLETLGQELSRIKEERDEAQGERDEVKREREQARIEVRGVQQELRDMQQRAEDAEQIIRFRDAALEDLRLEKACRDGIVYKECQVQAEVPRSSWAFDAGVQAVRLMKDQASQTPTEAPKPKRHINSLTKSCQTLAGRRPLVGEQNTQTQLISELERTQSWPRGSAELALACQANFLDLSRNLRTLMAKDQRVEWNHEVPCWLRGDREGEMDTLRRVLG